MSQAIFIGGTSIASSEAAPLAWSSFLKTTGIYLALLKVLLSAVGWYLAVAWLDFSGGPHIGLVVAILIGFFVMFFTLLLLAASIGIKAIRDAVHRIEGGKDARLNIDARTDSGPYAAANHVSPEAKPR